MYQAIPGIREDLSDYLDRHPEDAVRLSGLMDAVDNDGDIGERGNMKGHVVSSILVLDPGRTRALLIHHRALRQWLCPGGHHESGQTLYHSALRELHEETNLTGTRSPDGGPYLLDVDTHPIPARPDKGEGPHVHHDFLYLELCDHRHVPQIQEEEVAGADWFPINGNPDRLTTRMRRVFGRVLALDPEFLE